MPRPSLGEAAIGAVGYGVFDTTDEEQALPIASIAKVILATAVLREKPLSAGQASSTITITTNDVALYQADSAQNGSVVAVETGEQLTERQALEALLLPSANNIASTLADWAFGSETAYLTTYAGQMLAQMGLKQTRLDDASGYSPQTVSTPSELVLIVEAAFQNPLLAQIANERQAVLPVVGVVDNVNTDLGQRAINGIKTGNADQAGGCLLFSATRTIEGKK